MTQLVPCSACRRHVDVQETSCPFCSASLDFSAVAPPRLPTKRLGRAASFAFGATLVGALNNACEVESNSDGDAGEAGAANAGTTGGKGGSAAAGAAGGSGTASGGRGGSATGGVSGTSGGGNA
jgi:hypothetical protein